MKKQISTTILILNTNGIFFWASEKKARAILALSVREVDKRLKKKDKHLNNLGKQLGGLGRKFGAYTEYLAFPSIERYLRKKFNVDTIYKNFSIKSGDDQMEIDVYKNKIIVKLKWTISAIARTA